MASVPMHFMSSCFPSLYTKRCIINQPYKMCHYSSKEKTDVNNFDNAITFYSTLTAMINDCI